MAKIEFSQGFMSGLPARILKNTVANTIDIQNLGLLSYSNFYPHPQTYPYFSIFKGTKPSIATFKTNYASLMTNDCLLKFIHDLSNGPTELSPTVISNPIVISSIYKAADKSGDAAWFCLYRRYVNNSVQDHAILGDVGLIGSGADLELPDLNIVAGNIYRIDNFKINLPSSWEY